MLKIHESIDASGGAVSTFLATRDAGLVLVDADGEFPLPAGAVEAVMARFGRPLDPSADLVAVAALEIGQGKVLRHVRHLARFDVIAKDFLVLECPGTEPACALATIAAGALAHLGRANR